MIGWTKQSNDGVDGFTKFLHSFVRLKLLQRSFICAASDASVSADYQQSLNFFRLFLVCLTQGNGDVYPLQSHRL